MDLPPFEIVYLKSAESPIHAEPKHLLGQLGLTPQSLVWRAYQQKPEAVQQWLEKE